MYLLSFQKSVEISTSFIPLFFVHCYEILAYKNFFLMDSSRVENVSEWAQLSFELHFKEGKKTSPLKMVPYSFLRAIPTQTKKG